MTDVLAAALYSIPADDREMWVRMGMAIKSQLGDAGFDLWDSWSRQDTRPKHGYNYPDARAVWRSFKAQGGVTIGTLYHEAKEHGWQGEMPVIPEPSPEERQRRRYQDAMQRKRDRDREAIAEAKAMDMLIAASLDTHPYLAKKGFPDAEGLVLDGNLLIPMRHHINYYELQSVQTIDPDGNKRFLPGGRASHAVYKMGHGGERWYCEGYATALSVNEALKALYREKQSEVWVCFSAGNLPKVVSPSNGRSYVVADHDANGVGEKYAWDTGLPYWMPPDPGTDANDYHQQYGIRALADALRRLLNG